ncbi:MAG: imelysin family protein [Proteobacteria bacterium]|nr:imelysin family protein [Pseudomonadota bacterium]
MRRDKPTCLLAVIGLLFWVLSLKAAAAGQDSSFAQAIDRFASDVAIPTYQTLYERFSDLDESVGKLCATPGLESHNSASAAFRQAVLAWSAAEVIRFGPIRQENRLERIFFWPDTRSRGLRKIGADLAKGDIDAETELEGRSVAVQGLPALEFLLYGTGHEGLADIAGDAKRCAFAKAVSGNLVKISQDLDKVWKDPGGYQKILRNPGTDNPIFRSDGEVIQEILKSGAELVELVAVAKLQSPLGEDANSARPKRAAFWRSGLTVGNIKANIQAVVKLQERAQLSDMLPEAERGYARNLNFEAGQVTKPLESLIEEETTWSALLRDPESRSLLQYALNPLNGMKDILSIYYPEVLGLKLGFNSLDGD